jgi:CHAT domain-containing protein
MSDTHTSGHSIDPETLAAYVDGRLPKAERAKVEAALAADADAYEWLVHTLRAQDDLDVQLHSPTVSHAPRGDRPSEVLPFPYRRAAIATVASLLATAAALVLVVRLQPAWWQSLSGQPIDSRLEKLVAAVGDTRPSEARFTGGFKYGPLRSVTRDSGDLSKQDIPLLAAAGELQTAAESDPSAQNLHRWGVAQAQLGQHEAAVDTLRRAIEKDRDSTPRWRADLAAALIARGLAMDRAGDLAEAISLLEALLRSPSLPIEARFNYALALEHVGLNDAADKAWSNVLESESSSSPWAAEAARHRDRVREKLKSPNQAPWRGLRSTIESGQVSTAVFNEAHERFPRETRELLEDTLLPSYARNCIIEKQSACSSAHAAVETLARLRSDAGDAMALEGAARLVSLESQDPAAARRLAQAHDLYGRARAAFEGPDPVSSGPLFAEAGAIFAELHSPFALWCRNYSLSVDYFSQRYQIARDGADRLLDDAGRGAYPIVVARTYWLGGLVSNLLGDFERSLADYELAVSAYDRAHESAHVAFLRSSRGDVKELVGDTDGSWNDRIEAVRSIDTVDSVRRRHTILISALLLAMRQGFFGTAAVLADAALGNAAQSENQALVAESYLYRARARAASREADAALGDLAAAAKSLAQAPASVAARLRAELLFTRSDTLSAVGRREPALLQEAKDFFVKSGLQQRLPALERVRGRVASQEGDVAGAREAFQLALDSSREQRQKLAVQHRLSFADDSWGLLDEVLKFELDQGASATDLFHIADRFLAQDDRKSSGPSADPVGAQLRYLTLPDTLLISLSSSRGTREIRIDQSRDALNADITRFLEAAARDARAGDRDVRELGARIYDVLLAPFDAELDGVPVLAIVPDGPLHRLPFAALFDRRSGRFVVEKTAVHVLVGAGAASRQNASLAPKSLLISPSTESRQVLSAGRAEVQAISRMVANPVIWSGANTEPIDRLAAESTLVHFAGHARANPLYPAASWLEIPTAGAPRRLFAYELEKWHLRPGSLVVLAGCETGRGRLSRSEGPLSLARAFLNAGAASVIATAWDVDDRQSSELMLDFYRQIAGGAGLDDALRQAQLAALKRSTIDGTGPMTWAAYTTFTSPRYRVRS